VAAHPTISSSDDLHAIRSSRRRPAITQFDYLHLAALTAGLRDALAELPGPIDDVLDVWCGSRPYDDLLPAGARCIGLDVEGNPYGVADVVSNELLPFEDGSFDLVMCVQSFHYMDDPTHAIGEIARVLRPEEARSCHPSSDTSTTGVSSRRATRSTNCERSSVAGTTCGCAKTAAGSSRGQC
jgi:SAM-dependent methyltransferase